MNPVHHHVDRLDLNLLRIFAVVYRERHLTRAASSLCVTPSAVSHALRRLRAHFGDPLFIRDGKVMRPTPACARMAPEILEELAKLRSLLLRWGEFVPAHSRQIFRISMPEAVEPLILPDLMERLDVQAPEASAVSSRLNRRDMSSGLTNNIFDLAIDVSFTIDAPIRHQILFEDDFCVVVRPDHVLTGTLGLAEAYLAAQHIGVSGRSAGLLVEEAALLELGFSRHIHARCQDYRTAVLIAERTNDVLTMPRRLATALIHSRDLTIVELPFLIPPIRLSLYWHVATQEDAAIQWFRNVVLDVATQI